MLAQQTAAQEVLGGTDGTVTQSPSLNPCHKPFTLWPPPQGRLPTLAQQAAAQGIQEPLLWEDYMSTDIMPDGRNMDHTPAQCLRSLNFWLLWVANAVASGAGLTLLNNLGQQVRPGAAPWYRPQNPTSSAKP